MEELVEVKNEEEVIIPEPIILNVTDNARSAYALPPEILADKDEDEILRIVGIALKEGALESGKFAVFGLKSLLEVITSEQVSQATSSSLNSTGSALQLVTQSLSQLNVNDPMKIKENESLKQTLESSREAISSIGDTSRIIMDALVSSESGSIASDAVKNAGEKFTAAINASVSLARRNVDKLREEQNFELPGETGSQTRSSNYDKKSK